MARLVLDGECLRETLVNLKRGSNGKRLEGEALALIQAEAAELMEKVLTAYEADVGPGEVGQGGSARCDGSRIAAATSPTGLLYGLIQSGKTAAMIVAAAMAVDNGFRVVVVLTANNLKLVKQTFERFQALEGPLVEASGPGRPTWGADSENIAGRLGARGAVFVCAKNARHQRSLLVLLRGIGAVGYPALIFDDEADQATPDTTVAARALQTPGAPPHGSTTYRLTIQNDAAREVGNSFRETLTHNVFVQVTATPYALVLQNEESPLRPKFTKVIRPGEGYHGGDVFFGAVGAAAAPPLVYVDAAEDVQLHQAGSIPRGLARSLAFFLLAGASCSMRSGFPAEGFKHLSHTSPRTDEHDRVASLIRTYVNEITTELGTSVASVAGRAEVQWAYDELLRSVPSPGTLQELLSLLNKRIHLRRVVIINASRADDATFGSYFNLVVGGNILGRGLTIDNLLVTYYLRRAVTTQMDTMLQHARMYGYRGGLFPYTRVFLPRQLALRFRSIHDSESGLRDLLVRENPVDPTPVAVVDELRPTRPGILDPRRLSAYRPGQQVYPMEPVFERAGLGDSTGVIERQLRACGAELSRSGSYVEVSVDALVELVRAVPVRRDEPGDWDTDILAQVLSGISAAYENRGYLYVRAFARNSPILDSGAISGDEHAEARRRGRPVLFMFRESGSRMDGAIGPWDGVPFWYPTVVFPLNMPNQLFNRPR